MPLPIDPLLPDIAERLRATRNLVLVAPPGAGKTTRVPPALLAEEWAAGGKLILLEPRRLAARAAAERMAACLSETVGRTIGLRIRMETRVSRQTRIEVVTEGVFTRMILDDPALDGVAAVLFDEAHERSLEGDLGLALALDAQSGLREDLRLVAMSATLDGAAFARLMPGAAVIESEGRAFPVETRHLGRTQGEPVEEAATRAVLKAVREETGSVLVFLPGAREIRRTAGRLEERIADPSIRIAPLFGALSRQEQDAAILPAPRGERKIVLATSIAETSLTIEGIRVVVDCGLSRVPRHDPATGLTRLETVRVSRASADQRRGRAGRLEPGVCYRLWDEPETRALPARDRPEILEADLSPLVLTLSEWGVSDPAALSWLDPPPPNAFAEAQKQLTGLKALDKDRRITAEGRHLARLPLPPRLAHMVREGGRIGAPRLAADLAVLLSERGLGAREADLGHAVQLFRRDRSPRARNARELARSWTKLVAPGARDENDTARTARLVAAAWPDRIARARTERPGAFLLASGRGAIIDTADPLSRSSFLAVAELAGTGPDQRIVSAAPLDKAEIEDAFADMIVDESFLRYEPQGRSVVQVRQRRLGALVLDARTVPAASGPDTLAVLLHGIAETGLSALPWTPGLENWRSRVGFLRALEREPWPDLSDGTLLATLPDWLGPVIADRTAVPQIRADDLAAALRALLPWPLPGRLEEEAPSHFTTPSGSRLPIRYDADGAVLAVRVQEMFGLAGHPSVAGGRAPLTLELLSPAHRPVQVTRDLPGFWRGSYAAVRSEMRGRYPRHPWPEDPLSAPPTRRAKPRGT